MDATFLPWGLTISTKKTKVLVAGRDVAAQAASEVMTLRGNPLEVASQFKHLGSIFTRDLREAISCRMFSSCPSLPWPGLLPITALPYPALPCLCLTAPAPGPSAPC